MRTRFTMLTSICGILGVVMLIASFSLNPGPPQNATPAQLIAFGTENYTSVLRGAWLQAVGPLFIVLFALGIVFLAGASGRLEGWMTLLGSGILMMVSLAEVTFYIGALYGDNPLNMANISLDLIGAVQHLYFVVGAPSVFLPLGAVILGSRVLPRVFGYSAIALGLVFVSLGVVFLYDLSMPSAVFAFAGVQAVWWLAAAIVLVVRPANSVPRE